MATDRYRRPRGRPRLLMIADDGSIVTDLDITDWDRTGYALTAIADYNRSSEVTQTYT